MQVAVDGGKTPATSPCGGPMSERDSLQVSMRIVCSENRQKAHVESRMGG